MLRRALARAARPVYDAYAARAASASYATQPHQAQRELYDRCAPALTSTWRAPRLRTPRCAPRGHARRHTVLRHSSAAPRGAGGARSGAHGARHAALPCAFPQRSFASEASNCPSERARAGRHAPEPAAAMLPQPQVARASLWGHRLSRAAAFRRRGKCRVPLAGLSNVPWSILRRLIDQRCHRREIQTLTSAPGRKARWKQLRDRARCRRAARARACAQRRSMPCSVVLESVAASAMASGPRADAQRPSLRVYIC